MRTAGCAPGRWPPELAFLPKRNRKGEKTRKAGDLPSLLCWLLSFKGEESTIQQDRGRETRDGYRGEIWGTTVTWDSAERNWGLLVP